MPKTVRPLHERLWARVRVSGGDDCWPFTGTRYASGYGKIGVGMRGGGVMPASRAAWLVAVGPIPDGLDVCHHCDNPPCCNPSHLFLGTRGDNMRDASAKGRLDRKITKAERDEMLRRYLAHEGTARALAGEYGVSASAVENLAYAHRRRPASSS